MPYYFTNNADPFLAGSASYGGSLVATNRENKIRGLDSTRAMIQQAREISAGDRRQVRGITAQAAAQERGQIADLQKMQLGGAIDLQRDGARFQQQQLLSEADQAAMMEQRQFALQLEDERQRNQQENFDYEFTAQQKQRIARANEARQTIKDQVSRGQMSPEQGAYAEFSLDQQLAGIQPMPMPKAKVPTPEELMRDNIRPLMIPDGRGGASPDPSGRLFMRNTDGTWEVSMPAGKNVEIERKQKEKEAQIAQNKWEREHRLDIVDKALQIFDKSQTSANPMTFDQALERVGKLIGSDSPGGEATTAVYQGRAYPVQTDPQGRRGIVVNGRFLVEE